MLQDSMAEGGQQYTPIRSEAQGRNKNTKTTRGKKLPQNALFHHPTLQVSQELGIMSQAFCDAILELAV